ncbi:hypothetical protein ABZ143_002809 [Listeria monocytogenes]
MNATPVLDQAVVGAKVKEKVLKLLTKQLKQQKKDVLCRAGVHQVHHYEDKSVYTDGRVCFHLPASLIDKHISLNIFTPKEIEQGSKPVDPETISYPDTDRLFYKGNQLKDMAKVELDVLNTLKELKELKKKTVEQPKLGKVVRINQQTGAFTHCNEPKQDIIDKRSKDYGILVQVDFLINALSIVKEFGDKQVTFYLNKETPYRPIAIYSDNVKSMVAPIRYRN